MHFFYKQSVENDTKRRWFSVLRNGRDNVATSASQMNLQCSLFLGKRHESTVAASDAAAPPPPPAEKYEYQAEVC